MKILETAFGHYELQRLPLPSKHQKDNLRAWDAADELMLHYLAENHLVDNIVKPSKPILIINDAFGALAVSLNKQLLHHWSDSFVSHLATQQNRQLNILLDNEGDSLNQKLTIIPSIEKLTNQYDLVLIKIPKTLALLEHQLFQLKPFINQNTTIIAAGMVKHIHTSTLTCFEKTIGTTTTSHAKKKARLVFVKNDKVKSDIDKNTSLYPKTFSDDQLNIVLSNHANVFSKDHLDIGARFMIEYLDKCPKASHIIDLGCGNGVLGIIAKRLQPEAQISFVDESYMAVESAKTNYLNNISARQKCDAHFSVGDCLNQFKDETADLILCNPPFHQAHTIGDQIAWQMFTQSRKQLKPKGELWVIANRHLAYHIKLKRIFGNCRTLASNKKFVILVAKTSS